MFLSNTKSFLLVRSATQKQVVKSNIQEHTINLQTPSSDSGGSLFLSNSHSFTLVRSETPKRAEIPKQIVQTNIQENTTDLPPPTVDSSRKMFLSNSHSFTLVRTPTPEQIIQSSVQGAKGLPPPSLDSSKAGIDDKEKRTFLKVAGIAGAGLVSSLFLPGKADALIMGSSPTTGIVGLKDSTNARINPATEETLATLLKTSDLSFNGGALNVNVASLAGGSSSFSDSGDVVKSGLVDGDRHVQVDVLSSALPASASTETTLQTISFGGYKFSLRLETVGSVDYVGEAAIGTATSAAAWRIKKLDNTSGIIVQWAGTGIFDQVWDNRTSLSYS